MFKHCSFYLDSRNRILSKACYFLSNQRGHNNGRTEISITLFNAFYVKTLKAFAAGLWIKNVLNLETRKFPGFLDNSA